MGIYNELRVPFWQLQRSVILIMFCQMNNNDSTEQ